MSAAPRPSAAASGDPSVEGAVDASVDAVAPRPVVKWAGGKQALLPEILARVPDFDGVYREPFLGGASVALAVTARRPSGDRGDRGERRAALSDANAWLIDTYRAIRDDCDAVARVLDRLPNTKEDFLRIRAVDVATLDPATRAAHFVYLNKTCFRGLFRVNRAGRFNVPYGAYDRRYYDADNLRAVARALAGADLAARPFEEALAPAAAGDFVYLDPPYWKLGGHADFNRYTAGQFRAEDQQRLAALCRDLDARGVRWLLSNSDTDFVRELYAGFRQDRIAARREINLRSGKRDVRELLVSNG